MHSLCKTIVVLCCAGFVSWSPAVASSLNKGALTLGADYASAGNFTMALPQLRSAVKIDPADPIAHYYLGFVLTALNERSEGRHELGIAITLGGAQSTVGKLAQQKLDSLDALPAVSSSHPKANQINSTMSMIRQQASIAKNATQSNYDAYASHVQSAAVRAANELRAEEAQRIHYMTNEVTYDKWGGQHPAFTQAQIEAERQKYEEKIAMLMQQGAEDANSIRNQAQAKKEDLDNIADHLQSQMVDSKGKQSAPQLSPVGTNLYVRNYLEKPGVKSPPVETPPALAATMDKLILERVNRPGKYISRVVPVAQEADQDKLVLEKKGKQSATASLQVKGKLLPPPNPPKDVARSPN